MGVFDYVRCHYSVAGCGDLSQIEFQSKETPAQYLDRYEIRADGTLWYQAYDERWEADDRAPFKMWRHRDNERWEQTSFEGELEIHGDDLSLRFWFRDGVVRDVIVDREG